MASAKQLAWRKKFAKMAKSGVFRKKKITTAEYDKSGRMVSFGSPRKRMANPHNYKDKNPTETHSYYYILYLKGKKGKFPYEIGKSRVSKEYKKKADAIARAKELQNGFSVVKVYGKDKNEHIFREIGEVDLHGRFS